MSDSGGVEPNGSEVDSAPIACAEPVCDPTADQNEASDAIIIEALGQGLTHADAADLAGCSAKTVQRRKKDPAFLEKLRLAGAERVAKIERELDALSPEAVDVCRRLMNPDQPPSVQLAAAKTVFQQRLTYRSAAETDLRLEQGEDTVRFLGDALKIRQIQMKSDYEWE